MTITLTPPQDVIQTILRNYLLFLLPSGTEVIEGQPNRVPEPASPNFVVMTPVQRLRLSTNIDAYVDAVFTGSISGNTMTITQVQQGELAVGSTVFGTGIIIGTTITGFGPNTSGGAGTYTVSPSQNVSIELIAAGTLSMLYKGEIVYQLDVHSYDSPGKAANPGVAADMAQTIVTAFRDSYAVDYFQAQNQAVTPLYADDPKQVPFVNAEEQYESRWIVEAHIQADQTLTGFPQQFAATLGPISLIVEL